MESFSWNSGEKGRFMDRGSITEKNTEKLLADAGSKFVQPKLSLKLTRTVGKKKRFLQTC